MDLNKVFANVDIYLELREKFVKFCEKFKNLFPDENQYHLLIGKGRCYERELMILDNPAKIQFSHAFNSNEEMYGIISFYLENEPEDKILILKIKFDKLGNWNIDDKDNCPYNLTRDLHLTNHLSKFLLNAFLTRSQP